MTDASIATRPVQHASPLRSALPFVFAILIALLFHLVVGPMLGAYPSRVLLDIGVAVILAVSLNIVNGYTGQFSIGHAAFMTIGGYVAGAITYYTSLHLWGDIAVDNTLSGGHGWLLVVACLAGGVASSLAGWVVGLPSLRLRGDYLAIVTLGFGEIVRVLLQQTSQQFYDPAEMHAATWRDWLAIPVGGALGFSDLPPLTNLFWMYLAVGLTILFAYRLKQSSYGRALLSIREDEIAAEAMGINVTRLKVRAFIFAAFFAGLGGGLSAHYSIIRPIDAGFAQSFDIVIMVVLGGLGSISGAVVAAILLTVVKMALTEYGIYRMILYALLLIILMIFRPRGLFGVREIWDFLPASKRKFPVPVTASAQEQALS